MRSCLLASRILIVFLMFTAACGTHRGLDPKDDDDSSDAGKAGRGGSSAGAGRGGAGGSAGSAPVTVRCGSKQCAAPMSALSALPIPTAIPAPVACCADEATGTCGSAASAGAICERPAVPDARCPGINLGQLGMLGGMPAMQMSGCCVDNKCGLDGALFGRGCVENGEAQSTLAAIPFIGNLIDVPAPRACDAPPAADGGTEDAG
jgi:hypothetical protein